LYIVIIALVTGKIRKQYRQIFEDGRKFNWHWHREFLSVLLIRSGLSCSDM